MAAFLRPAIIRILSGHHRLAGQPVCLSRPLCKAPPKSPEQNGEAKTETTTNTEEPEEQSLKSQENTGSQSESLTPPPQEAGGKEAGKTELHHEKHTPESDVGKQKISGPKKTYDQKKLYDLLSSLANTDPIPMEPVVQLSRPKARRKKEAKTAEKSTPPPEPDPVLEPELVSATKDVAESLGGDTKETESELLSALRHHSAETAARAGPSLSELFVGMKVERKPKAAAERASHRPPRDGEVSPPRRSPSRDLPRPHRSFAKPAAPSGPRTPIDLFGSEPLGIFNKKEESPGAMAGVPTSMLATWDTLHQHKLQQSLVHPPTNAFVEMIQWTNEGKLWTFPIDNEIGLEEEKSVGFHEHVFLERHLEGWCPQRGPVRHFMELVCTGLSKNPYLTVQRKQAHILWYKNYFSQKEDLLKDLGAIETAITQG